MGKVDPKTKKGKMSKVQTKSRRILRPKKANTNSQYLSRVDIDLSG